MARAPLLQLSDVALTFGGRPLFDGVDLVVRPGDRVSLVGRNGSGKSTLMRLMAGEIEPDRGARTLAPGVRVGRMEQAPDFAGHATLGDFAAATLEPGEAWRVEMAAEGLDFDPGHDPSAASGGERRRAALARLMAEAPDLMLIDEPTNHLDIHAIAWLEDRLAETRAAYILISHDRALLRNLTRATLWIDRGEVRRREAGFEGFEDWRDAVWAAEDEARHKLDRKIRAEARWAVEGISARRKRNQGRLRALRDLRAERSEMTARQGAADMALAAGPASGRRVIEARGIAKAYGGHDVVRPFSIRIGRGERVAIVGPNGAGKTTLLKMLTGELAPDRGEVDLGTKLSLAVFDQDRAALDPDLSLWESLTEVEGLKVKGSADQVMVRGQPRHVVGYLKDFLFTEAQARGPVRALSGGEAARLLLARLMARESNLLVLDEPTNDLDLETLDLLQEILDHYAGTVLLVSHDRDFLDRVATATVLMEEGGRATIYAGGWSDMVAQRGGPPTRPDPAERRATARPRAAGRDGGANGHSPNGGEGSAGSVAQGAATHVVDAPAPLTFTERHRLAELPARIARLEAEIAKLEELLSDPELFSREPVKFAKATEALTARQGALAEAETDWLELENRAEA